MGRGRCRGRLVKRIPDPLALVEDRSCGSCTACCTHLAIDSTELQKAQHEECAHLVDKRCDVYATRPGLCRTFRCAWLEGVGNAEARPDRSGALLFVAGGTDGKPFLSSIACREGALDEGTAVRAALNELGYAMTVIMVHRDGRKQAIHPMAPMQTIDVPTADA